MIPQLPKGFWMGLILVTLGALRVIYYRNSVLVRTVLAVCVMGMATQEIWNKYYRLRRGADGINQRKA